MRGQGAGWLPVLVLIACLLLGLVACQEPAETDRQVVFAIPAGSAARLAAGEPVKMLPSTIRLVLGKQDVLVIRNDDSAPVSIDGLRLQPGQRATQRFYTAGTFELVCSGDKHTEQVRIIVEAAAD